MKDRDGLTVKVGDTVMFKDGTVHKIYETQDGKLGIDATNPSWIINRGYAPCSFGLYELDENEEVVIL